MNKNTKKVIKCELCDKVATRAIQPDGGSVSYWCEEHFQEQLKELES